VPSDEADRLRRGDQVVALGHGQAGHPEPEGDRDPDREPRPQRAAEGRQGESQEEPHHEADEQAEDRRDELGRGQLLDPADEPGGGHDGEVRQHGEPDHDPGTSQTAMSAPA